MLVTQGIFMIKMLFPTKFEPGTMSPKCLLGVRRKCFSGQWQMNLKYNKISYGAR